MPSDILFAVGIVTWGVFGYAMGYIRGRTYEMKFHRDNDVRYVSRGDDDE